MSLNPYSKPSEQKILPYNTDMIAGLAEYNQKRYDAASGEYDDILGAFNKIPALQQDVPKRQEIVNKYRSQLDNAYKQSQGDYTKMLPVLKRLKNDFQNDAAYGQIGAIIGQYSNAAAYNKQIDEALSKGTIDGNTANILKSHANSNYKGIGGPNEFGQFPGQYQGRTPAKNVDIYDKADKLAKGWEANKIAKEGAIFDNQSGRLYTLNSKGEREWVDGNEVKQYVKRMLQQDPEVQAHVDQQTFVDTYGITPDSEIYGADQNGNRVQVNPVAYVDNYKQSLLEEPANYMGAKYGYERTAKGTSNRQADDYAMEDYKNQADSYAPYSGNLPSVRIPQNDKLKVNIPYFNDQSSRREYTPDEKLKVYKQYNIKTDANGNPDMLSNPSGYQSAAADIAAGIPKDENAKPITIKFNKEQLEILERAEEEYGWTAATDESKAKLINKFIDYNNDKLTNPGFEFTNPSNPKAVKTAENAQKLYFGEEGTGGGYTNNNFKLVSGEGKEQLSGQEISAKYGKNRKQITGSITPDNFITASGYLVSIQDDNGQEIAKYAMEMPPSQQDDIKHKLYKAKYNANGKSILPIQGEDGKQHNFTVVYRDKSDSVSDDQKHTPNVTGNYVEIYEPGNPIPIGRADSETSYDSFIDAYKKAIENLNKK